MAEFHFVEDYEKYVAHLIETMPIDEAMSLAVGGDYDGVGDIERSVLTWAGLENGGTLVDLGCGSGRLASSLGRTMEIEFIGVDIVQSLLDYAQTKSPPNYRFINNHALKVPADDDSATMVSAFSLFTHLLNAETFLYLEDVRRVLKPGGKLVFSFLEFTNPEHWGSFMSEVDARRVSAVVPLNAFIERAAIHKWADALGFTVRALVDGTEAPWGGLPMWQAVCVLEKPQA